MTDADICASCVEGGISLRCVVWRNGTVWTNPKIISGSGSITGYEETTHERKGVATLRTRFQSIVVRFNETLTRELSDADAVCVQYVSDHSEASKGATEKRES